jgi:hypothetical protein
VQNAQVLSWQLARQCIDAGHGAARSIHASYEAHADRIGAGVEDDRDRRGADLLQQFLGRDETGENDHANLALCQIGQLGGQALIPAIREAVFDSDIAAFGIADVCKATAGCNEHRGIGVRRPAADISYHRHRALLCVCGKRP